MTRRKPRRLTDTQIERNRQRRTARRHGIPTRQLTAVRAVDPQGLTPRAAFRIITGQ